MIPNMFLMIFCHDTISVVCKQTKAIINIKEKIFMIGILKISARKEGRLEF